jgi:hypothetical protein
MPKKRQIFRSFRVFYPHIRPQAKTIVAADDDRLGRNQPAEAGSTISPTWQSPKRKPAG